MKVGIFLNTTSGSAKQEYMMKFAEGVKRSRDTPLYIRGNQYVDCDIALIFGFYCKNLNKTHLLRRKVYLEQSKRNKKCIFIDADLFRFAGKIVANKSSDPSHHVRLAYGSIYPGEAEYFNCDSPPDRWNLIRKRKKIDLLEWRKSGDHILICANSDPEYGSGWATRGVGMTKWLKKTVKEIRSITDRPIIIRYHPNAKEAVKKNRPWQSLTKYKNIKFSGGIISNDKNSKFIIKNTSVKDDCINAHACVVYNTSASVISIINGIPVFTERLDCPVSQIANKKIKNIENPILYDRSQWLYNASYSIWTKEEMSRGLPWKRIRSKI